MTDRTAAGSLRAYQAEAVAAISAGLRAGAGRGQLRASCGTGKTFIASVVAAALAGGGVTVLLVPSIALAAQTITDWYAGGRRTGCWRCARITAGPTRLARASQRSAQHVCGIS
jgi:predicted helicase